MVVLGENRKKLKPRGRPFPKGNSANPGGRPRRTPEETNLIEACKAKTPEALAVIEDIMHNGSSERVRLQAAEFIIERAWGRAPMQIEHTGDGGGPIIAELLGSDLTPEQAYAHIIEGRPLVLPSEANLRPDRGLKSPGVLGP